MKIALVGNPNSGKSTLFNLLTGLNQKVGNYPGVTVDRKLGKMELCKGKTATLIDLPGIYTLYPSSEDEQIACEIIRNPRNADAADVWILVADATQLRRSLLLLTQMMDLKLPVVLAVNMVDLLADAEKEIDFAKLSKLLQVPVVPVSAKSGLGLKEIKEILCQPVSPSTKTVLKIPEGLSKALETAQKLLNTQHPYAAYQALLTSETFSQLSASDRKVLHESYPIANPKALIANEMLVRYEHVDELLEKSTKVDTTRAEHITTALDKVFLHPFWGYVFFIGILLVIFQFLFAVASYPMAWIESAFSWITVHLHSLLPQHFLTDLFIDGIVAGISGVVVFVPQIAFLFFFIALLEETGYMSRVVFLMDKIMRPFGFSGRSVIPLIGGMACAVPSIMMTRTIPNPKERLITLMVTPLMSCSARIPVYVLLVALFIPKTHVLFGLANLQGLVMLGLYLLGFLMALIAAFVFKKVLKYKSDGVFVSEMPMYRLPRVRNVGLTIWQKSHTFVTEAGKIIVIISMVLWLLASFGPGDTLEKLDAEYASIIAAQPQAADSLTIVLNSQKLENSYAGMLGKTIEPAIRPLGFDWKIGIALLTSFAAREVFVGTMATIYSVNADEEDTTPLVEKIRLEKNPITQKPQYDTAVAVALLLFYAFAMQCMSTLAAVKRETASWKWTMIILLYLTALAYLSALIAYQVLK